MDITQYEYLILRTNSFELRAEGKPLVDRNDGGHIAIYPKKRIPDRQCLTPKQAIEFMRLTMVAGEAMTNAMRNNGVDIGRINYQDNGNWSVFSPAGPYFHLHIYGRAISAKIQKYGQSLNFPHREEYPEFYQKNSPLSKEDIEAIRNQIDLLMRSEKYSDPKWDT